MLFCDASGCGKVGFALDPLQKLANLILSATLVFFFLCSYPKVIVMWALLRWKPTILG